MSKKQTGFVNIKTKACKINGWKKGVKWNHKEKTGFTRIQK